MTDNISQNKRMCHTLHLKKCVLKVASRHAIKQNMLLLMDAGIQRINYLFCNVP